MLTPVSLTAAGPWEQGHPWASELSVTPLPPRGGGKQPGAAGVGTVRSCSRRRTGSVLPPALCQEVRDRGAGVDVPGQGSSKVIRDLTSAALGVHSQIRGDWVVLERDSHKPAAGRLA